MLLAILFHFLCTQHVSDINISIIIRNLRLCCWITTSIVLFLVRCVLEIWCGWVGAVSVLQAEAQLVLTMFRTLICPSSGACDYSVESPSWSYCSWFDVCWRFGVVGLEWYPCCRPKHNLLCFSLQHGYTHRTKDKTTNVVIQQNSRKLLMMDILMSKTCWAHKKWNKIASDIKSVFYSSTITMMHSPINIRSQLQFSVLSSKSFCHSPAGQNLASGPSNTARFLLTGTVSSLRVRWGGWSPSWLVPVRATEVSRSKLMTPSGFGYSIGLHSDTGFSLL